MSFALNLKQASYLKLFVQLLIAWDKIFETLSMSFF